MKYFYYSPLLSLASLKAQASFFSTKDGMVFTYKNLDKKDKFSGDVNTVAGIKAQDKTFKWFAKAVGSVK